MGNWEMETGETMKYTFQPVSPNGLLIGEPNFYTVNNFYSGDIIPRRYLTDDWNRVWVEADDGWLFHRSRLRPCPRQRYINNQWVEEKDKEIYEWI